MIYSIYIIARVTGRPFRKWRATVGDSATFGQQTQDVILEPG